MNSGSHVNKSKKERLEYHRQIRKVPYEDTVDEFQDDRVKYDETIIEKEDVEDNEDHLKLQKDPWNKKIGDSLINHLKNSWVGYLFSFIVLVIGLFIFDFNRDLGVIEGKVDSISTSIQNVNTNNSKISNKIENIFQRLTVTETQIKYIENKNENSNSRSEIIIINGHPEKNESAKNE